MAGISWRNFSISLSLLACVEYINKPIQSIGSYIERLRLFRMKWGCCLAVAVYAGSDFHVGRLLLMSGCARQINMISSKFNQRDDFVRSICFFCLERSRKEKMNMRYMVFRFILEGNADWGENDVLCENKYKWEKSSSMPRAFALYIFTRIVSINPWSRFEFM